MIRQLLKTVFTVFLFPLTVSAQTATPLENDLTGLWKGFLYNDTTRKNLPYQIAISEEKGKLSGYSYTLFDIDGKKEQGVKKIKIKLKDDQVIIEDVELISNDYSAPPPKKVRQTSVANLLVNDTSMQLTGKWNTNQTKEYRPLTGTLQLQRAVDFKPLALFKKLVELKLDQSLSFVKEENNRNAEFAIKEKAKSETNPTTPPALPITDADKPAMVAVAGAEKKTAAALDNKPSMNIIKPATEPVAVTLADAPEVAEPAPMKKISQVIAVNTAPKMKPVSSGQTGIKISTLRIPKNIVAPPAKEITVAVNNTKKTGEQLIAEKEKAIATAPVTNKTKPVAIITPVKKENKPPADIVKKAGPIEKPVTISTPVSGNKTLPVIAAKEPLKTPAPVSATLIAPPVKNELPANMPPSLVKAAAANVAERKMNSQQSVFFESDSLVLTLYDNGDVDGDTVSVLMNGQIIFAKQGLSTKANSKTIYIEKGMPDTLSMIMYAENLGSIPPNTGLMIIMDGEKRYEVRFSADLKNNAAILLRRRNAEK